MPDHLAEEAALSNGADLHEQRAGRVDRAANDRIAFALFDWNRLAGDQRLIDAGTAAHDGAVRGNALAGPNTHEIAKGGSNSEISGPATGHRGLMVTPWT